MRRVFTSDLQSPNICWRSSCTRLHEFIWHTSKIYGTTRLQADHSLPKLSFHQCALWLLLVNFLRNAYPLESLECFVLSIRKFHFIFKSLWLLFHPDHWNWVPEWALGIKLWCSKTFFLLHWKGYLVFDTLNMNVYTKWQ